MALIKLDDFNSSVDDIRNFSVYAAEDKKVGLVSDILIDGNTGILRYFVVDTGFLIFGKKVLLPAEQANVDYQNQEIYVRGLTREKVENLPNFDDLDKVDYSYEEQLQSIYCPAPSTYSMNQNTVYDRGTYSYGQQQSSYYSEQTMSKSF